MHRFHVASALFVALSLALSGSASCQNPEELESIKEQILGEFDKRAEKLYSQLRKELSDILDKAGERTASARKDAPGEIKPAPKREPKKEARRADALPDKGEVEKGGSAYLGIKTRELSPELRSMLDLAEGTGVVVKEVRKESPAEQGGLKKHDVIVEVDGKATGSGDDVRTLVGKRQAGDKVAFLVVRRGEKTELTVKLGARSAGATTKSESSDKKSDAEIDQLLDELLAEEGGKAAKKKAAPKEKKEGTLDGLRREIPEQYRQMLESEEGRRAMEDQLSAFNQMLDTPEGRQMMMMQVEQFFNQMSGEEGLSEEDMDKTHEMLEEFMERDSGDRMDVIRGLLEMMGSGENPLDGGLERLLGKDKAEPKKAPKQEKKAPAPPAEKAVADKGGFLGVAMDELTDAVREERKLDKEGGVLLRTVHPGGPAEAGGVKGGDVITAIDGKKISGAEELVQRIRSQAPDTEVELTLVDAKGETRKAKVKLGKRPE